MKKLFRRPAFRHMLIVSFLLGFFLPGAGGLLSGQSAPDFITVGGDWKGSVFGDIGGQDKLSSANFEITEKADGTVAMRSANDRGKIASTSEGIAFYFRELPSDAGFTLSARAEVGAFAKNNQVSFGIMVRDKVFTNESVKDNLGNYLAVGPVNAAATTQYVFNRTAAGFARQGDLVKSPQPAPGAVYELRLRKYGKTFELTFGDETPVVLTDFTGFSGDRLFAGFFTSRNTAVTFSNVKFTLGTGTVPAPAATPVTSGASVCTGLEIVFPPLRTEYYPQDRFDPSGLTVRAVYNGGLRSVIAEPEKYRLTIGGNPAEGYLLSSPGTVPVTIVSSENPATTASFSVAVKNAALTGLEIGRPPVKTRYFTGEALDLSGMVVYARYGDGSGVRLSPKDYSVLPFDSKDEGVKKIELTYKTGRASIAVEVVKRKAVGLEVTSYPSTTVTAGGAFSREGMAVSRVYDSGDRETLPETAWSVDTSGLDTSVPGTGRVRISAPGTGLAPVEIPVTVRSARIHEWKTMRFGQSTKEATNFISVKADGSVELTALEGGGKVTGDHDGISYYYTVLDAAADNFTLEADIGVSAFAKNPHDGQEAFGIMARDTIGAPGDSSVSASNIACVGGYSGGTRNDIGTQLFIRTGVTSPDGAGSRGIQRIMLQSGKPGPANTAPAAPYHLVLRKTNSGYSGRIGNGKEETFFEPDILNVQSGKLYVGFFTARLATVTVKNVRLTVSAAATDAPRIIPPPAPVSPVVDILSPAETSEKTYTLVVRSNVDGSLLVTQGFGTPARDIPVAAGAETAIASTLAVPGETPFVLSFTPDDRRRLTSYEPLLKTFLVTAKSYAPGGNIVVSPAGTPDGTGTDASPLDLDTAVAFVRPGQSILLSGGVYPRSAPLVIGRFNDGVPGAPKRIEAMPGERPVIDFGKKSAGITLSGDWWQIRGIDVARSAGNTNGLLIGGNRNTVTGCRFYENGDTGLQISRTELIQTRLDTWPSYNLIEGCESYDNRDPSENNADGFAAKITSGPGNVFRNCIAHNNIDDGWDLYTKAGSGPIGAVLIESCVAFANGTLTNGTVGKGDKNGFKLGGEGIAVGHTVRGCLAFGNGAAGFTNNSNPLLTLENCFSFANAGGNLVLQVYPKAVPDFTVNGFLSFAGSASVPDTVPWSARGKGNWFLTNEGSVNSSDTQLSFEAFIAALERAGFPKDLLDRKR